MLDRSRVAERDEIEDTGESDEDDGEPDAAQRPVTPVERETAYSRRGAGDENDVQWDSSQFFDGARRLELRHLLPR
jgi:hypothetical protein